MMNIYESASHLHCLDIPEQVEQALQTPPGISAQHSAVHPGACEQNIGNVLNFAGIACVFGIS